MAHAAPDLASCPGSGGMSRTMEDTGTRSEPEVQKQGSPSPVRSTPHNFVWRSASQRSNSTSPASEVTDGTMAVVVPVRASFDPWRRDFREDDRDGQQGRCQGCSKIPKARVAADAPAPHVIPRGKFVALPHVCDSCIFDQRHCRNNCPAIPHRNRTGRSVPPEWHIGASNLHPVRLLGPFYCTGAYVAAHLQH